MVQPINYSFPFYVCHKTSVPRSDCQAKRATGAHDCHSLCHSFSRVFSPSKTCSRTLKSNPISVFTVECKMAGLFARILSKLRNTSAHPHLPENSCSFNLVKRIDITVIPKIWYPAEDYDTLSYKMILTVAQKTNCGSF